MRRKLLNPNSMEIIMENFRRYAQEVEEEYGKSISEANLGDAESVKMYLFESANSKSPTSEMLLDDLMEEYKKGVISEKQLFEWADSSINHYFKVFEDCERQILLQEGPRDWIKKGAGALQKGAAAGAEYAKAGAKKAAAGAQKAGAVAKGAVGKHGIVKGAAVIGKAALKTAGWAALATGFIIMTKLFQGALWVSNAVIKKLAAGAKGKKGPTWQGNIAKIVNGWLTKSKEYGKQFAPKFKEWMGKAKEHGQAAIAILGHPLFKACLLILAVGVLAFTAMGGIITCSFLLMAPGYAGRKFGFEAVKKVWKIIPDADPAPLVKQVQHSTTQTAQGGGAAAAAAAGGKQGAAKLQEVEGAAEMEQMWSWANQAMEVIADSMESGEEATKTTHSLAVQHGGTEGAQSLLWQENTNAEASAKLDALVSIQEHMDGVGAAHDVEGLLAGTAKANDAIGQVIKTAGEIARLTCTEDPTVCPASKMLQKSWAVLEDNVTVDGKLINYSVQGAQDATEHVAVAGDEEVGAAVGRDVHGTQRRQIAKLGGDPSKIHALQPGAQGVTGVVAGGMKEGRRRPKRVIRVKKSSSNK